jgi:uncharacterized protein YjiS (DUF1127 family)
MQIMNIQILRRGMAVRPAKYRKVASKMILSASAQVHGRAAQFVCRSVVGILQRWWATYTAWRTERRAIAELLSMSDRDLRDIGINRCEILRAARGDTARDRISVHDAMPISRAISRPSNLVTRSAAWPVG